MTTTDNRCVQCRRDTGAANTLCMPCLQQAARRITALADHAAALRLDERHTQPAPQRSHTPHSVVPLNIAVDAVVRDITDTLMLAAEIVADTLELDDPTELDTAATLVADNIVTLADIRNHDIFAWTHGGERRELTTTSGTAIIVRLCRLHALSRMHLGLSLARTHRDMPCDRCGARTVGRWAGRDYYDCEQCGQRTHVNDLRRHDKILLERHRLGTLRIDR